MGCPVDVLGGVNMSFSPRPNFLGVAGSQPTPTLTGVPEEGNVCGVWAVLELRRCVEKCRAVKGVAHAMDPPSLGCST